MATYRGRRNSGPSSSERIARGLGWFSIGFGVAQIVAPRAMARLTGLPLPAVATRLCGLREVACGIGILTQPEPRPWVQARVAGDALDLAVCAGALLVPGTDRRRAVATTAAVAGVTALDAYCSRELARNGRRPGPRHVIEIVEVNRSPEELYRFWRALENLPRIIPQLQSVQALDERLSHWVATAFDGERVEWDAELIDDAPPRCIAWRSVEGSRIFHAGSVQLEALPGGATEVRVELLYDVPPDSLGDAVLRLFGRGAREGRADLAHFKQLMEAVTP
jgi:uncharacterized membrane protein